MARPTTRRIVLGSVGLFSALGAADAHAGPRLPRTSVTLFERRDRTLRQWFHRDLPPLANQALWAGGAERMGLRWDVHLPPRPEEEDEDEKNEKEDDEKDDEPLGGDDEDRESAEDDTAAEKSADEDEDEDEDDERIVTLGTWPLPGAASLAKAIERHGHDAPPPLPGRATHERPTRPPRSPLWLSATFVLRRGKSTLALGTFLIPTKLTRRLARTEGEGFRVRWSALIRGRRRLAEAPLGEHDAFARLPF